MGLSASKGMARMWALLPDGTYRTNRTYGSGHMSPIGLVGHICSRSGAGAYAVTPIRPHALLAPRFYLLAPKTDYCHTDY
jgi:hypothetical protein